MVCTHCLQFFLFLSLLNPLPWLSTPLYPWHGSCQDNQPPLCCSIHHPELRLVFIPWPCWTWLITISSPSRCRSHSKVRLLLPCCVILNIFPTLWILEGSRLSSWIYSFGLYLVVVLQWLSCVPLFATPWTVAHHASLSFTVSWSWLKLMSIESMMLSNHLILCHLLLLLPSVRVFSNESALLIRWPKYWSFSFSISPSKGYSVLIFFRIDWFDLLAVQGTLHSLLQHHSSKASIFQCSAFFMVQLSHPYMTTV